MKNIVLVPDRWQLYVEKLFTMILTVLSVIFIGSDNIYIRWGSFFVMCFCLMSVFIYWLWLHNLKWIITEQTLEIYTGILNKNKDMLELYRVVDYQETQTLIQRIFGVKNLIIHSTDRNNKKVIICGVKENNSAIDIIRERVEYNKQLKRVYEISNR